MSKLTNFFHYFYKPAKTSEVHDLTKIFGNIAFVQFQVFNSLVFEQWHMDVP